MTSSSPEITNLILPPELLPVDIGFFRHGQPERDHIPQMDMDDPNWRENIALLDVYQSLKPEGHEQAHALGRRLVSQFPDADICFSSDFERTLETAWTAMKEYPEESRPKVVPFSLLRERSRGKDHPIVIRKTEFTELYPDQARIREETPTLWHPRLGETHGMVNFRLNATLLDIGALVGSQTLLMSTSGEVCISAFSNPNLGNMNDEQLVNGFGPGRPAVEYELTALTHYTRRKDPFDAKSDATDQFGFMRVMTPDISNLGELAWDTGWLEIVR